MLRQWILLCFALSVTQSEGERQYIMRLSLWLYRTYTGTWGCASGFMNRDLLVMRARKISARPRNVVSPNMLTSGQFLVIPGMKFTCSGVITSFLLGVDVRNRGRLNEHLRIDLWRGENNTGFVYVSSLDRIRLAAGEFSPDGVLCYNLSRPVFFRSGDVLVVYQPQSSIVRLFYTTPSTPPIGYDIQDLDYFNTLWVSTSGRPLFNGSLLLRPVTGE